MSTRTSAHPKDLPASSAHRIGCAEAEDVNAQRRCRGGDPSDAARLWDQFRAGPKSLTTGTTLI